MTEEEYAKEVAQCKQCRNNDFCWEKDNVILPKCEKWEWLFIGIRKGFAEGRKEAEKQWHDCFLSCSSPYCAGHFPTIKLEGELGNMSKHEEE